MAIIRTVTTSIVARTANFERGMKRSRDATTKFTSAVSLTTKAMGALGVAFSVQAVANWTRHVLSSADAVGQLATRLSASTDDIQTLQFIGRQSGITFEQLSTIMQRFRRRIGEVQDGSEHMRKAFDDLGISANKLANLGLLDQFKILASTIEQSGATAEQQIARIAKVLDVEGVRLFQAINNGTESLRELEEQAKKELFGEDVIRDIEKFNNGLARMIGHAKALTAKSIGGVFNFFDNIRAPLIAKDQQNAAIRAQIAAAATFPQQSLPFLGPFPPKGSLDTGQVHGPNNRFGLSQKMIQLNQDEIQAQERLLSVSKRFAVELENLDGISDELALSYASAFENFITGANDARSAIQQLGRELILLTTRRAFIEPAAQGLGQFTSNLIGGFGLPLGDVR